jgi:hypothetical protein
MDINIADYGVEMGVSRFTKEGALEVHGLREIRHRQTQM